MIDNYINNFENTMATILFISFKIVLVILIALLILSLLILIFGCLIKSQKIKSKFLKVVPILLVSNIFLLCIPYFLGLFKSLI